LESLEEKFNLNTVSLTGDDPERFQSLYTFEGQEYSRKLNTPGLNFIDIGTRQRNPIMTKPPRKIDFEVQSGVKKERTKLKGWRLTANGGHDHQFFDSERLDALEAKGGAEQEFTEVEQAER
jgi:hypothetical protein